MGSNVTTAMYISQELTKNLLTGSVAERSNALVLGTSLTGGVGSNPTAAICFFLNNSLLIFYSKVMVTLVKRK